MAFAQELAERRSLPLTWVQQAMGQAQMSPQVIRLMQPPASPLTKNWRIYRSRFLDQPRIAAGVAFWRAHASELERAEKTYGVPAAIVVGILGVETIYGQEMGRFRVLDALSTLAFDFPVVHPRAAERQASLFSTAHLSPGFQLVV
jgi:membrane-bound lytic murein transglycosylase B